MGEDRHRQKGDQLLVKDIVEVSSKVALCHALEDVTATFVRISPEPLSESQQPLVAHRRAEAFD